MTHPPVVAMYRARNSASRSFEPSLAPEASPAVVNKFFFRKYGPTQRIRVMRCIPRPKGKMVFGSEGRPSA